MIAYLEKYDTTAEVPDDAGANEVKDINDNFPAYKEQQEPTEAVAPGKIAPEGEATPPPQPEQKWVPNLYESLLKPFPANLVSAAQTPEGKAFAAGAIKEGTFGLIKSDEGQDHPAFAEAGELTGGVGSLLEAGGALRIAGLAVPAAAAGSAAVEAGMAAGERFIPRAIMSGATFGTRTFIAETVKAFEEGGVNLEQFGKDVLKDTAFGATFGAIEGLEKPIASISSAGALGFISSKMGGGDNREAALNAAIWGAFETVGSVGKSEALRMEALNNLKESVGEYAQGRNPDLTPEQARAAASAFVDHAVSKAGFENAEAIAKSGPENLLEGIEKVNQMVRTAKVPSSTEPGVALPKLPAPATPAGEAPPAAPEPPKSPLDKAIDTVKEMVGMKPKEPEVAPTPPPKTIDQGMKEISDRLTIHGVTDPEKEAIFGHYAENLPALIRQPIEDQYQTVYNELAKARGVTKEKPDSKTMDDAQKSVDLINGYFHPGSQEMLDFAKAHPEASTQDVAQMAHNRGLLDEPNQDLMMNELQKAKQENIPTHPMLSESGSVMIPPDLADLADSIRNSSEEIRNLVAPAKAAPLAAQITREQLGKMARSSDMAEQALNEAHDLFEKQPKEANIDFIDKMEHGQKQDDPKMEAIAKQLRIGLDTKRNEIQDLGTGKLKAFNENYFPHIWDQGEKEVGQVVQKVAKRPFEGSKAFLKARSIEFTKDGIAAGLTPVSYNPVDLTLPKMREMDKYIMAHKTLNEFKENGLAQFVKVGGDIPDGWQKIDDRISTVMFKGEQGLTISGHIYAQPDAARIINNYLSPGLGKSSLFQAYRYAGNLMNQFQLGLSAFHLGFVGLEGSVSKLSLAIRELSKGHPLNAIRQAIETPFAPISTIIKGDELLKAWRGEGKTGVDNILANAMATAGGRARMDQFYATKAVDQMKHYFQTGRFFKGILSAPFAALDLSMRPTLEYYVPRMKLGAFSDIMRMEMENNPNMTHDQMRQIGQRAWDSVDNRFGQLVYDNLFWNRTFKDLLMASQRSVGWNLGTIRELGGGVIDFAKAPFKGKDAEVTDKMGHLIALPFLVGALGAMIQYLRTGKGPQTLKDYYYPQTGGVDEKGNPHRSTLPSYMKDIYNYTDDPLKTISNKLSPLLATIGEMLQNKDYYGTKIRNEDDPLVKQVGSEAMFLAKQMEPFSIRNMQKNLETGNKSLFDTVGPWVGITPAPYDINQTKAEKMAHDIAATHQEIGGRTEEQFQRSRLLTELTRQYRMGDQNATKNLYAAYQEGMISHRQMQNVIIHASMTPLQRMVNGMTLTEAQKVYSKATDEEKAQIERILRRKEARQEKEYVAQ